MTSSTSSKASVHRFSHRNKLALLFSLISFIFLFPGIYLSMLSVSTKGSVNTHVPHIQHNFIGIPSVNGTDSKHISLNILDTTRSILKTIHDLWDKDYYFVGGMILLFSVIIPFMKSGLMTYLFFTKNPKHRLKIFEFIKAIGKWSMCDVFIVAIFLAYLSTGAAKNESVKNMSLMGYSLNVDVLTSMHAELHVGFWCFLTYCILSLLALQLYEP